MPEKQPVSPKRMTFLPIVDRELRVSARRQKTYWIRLAAALAALGICAWYSLTFGRLQAPVTLGKSLFTSLSILAFGYCLLVGPFLTADSMSEEKRDGTLGLLFLTDLHSYDVVLGKWVASSLAGLYGLLAILPALGLPLLFGGVTPGEYGRTALAVLNAIFFSLTAGLFVSTLSREQSKAILASVVLILGVTGLLPGLSIVWTTAFFTKPLTTQFPAVALASPAYTGVLATDNSFRAAPGQYWLSLGMVHGAGWLFLLLTTVLLPRVWREQAEGRPAGSRWLLRLGYTRGWRRAFLRRLERNPVLAMAARLRWPHYVFWSLVAIVAVNVYWLTYGYRKSPNSLQVHLYFSHAMVFINRIWIAAMACRFFLEARRNGALELMLTTPLPVATLMRGHWQALRRLFVGPVLVIAALHVFYVMGTWYLASAQPAGALRSLPYSIAQASGSLVSFLSDVVALCWVGAWLSLSSRRPNLVIFQTFALVVLIPWVVAAYMPSWRLLAPTNMLGTVLVRPVGWVAKNTLFFLWAWWGLRRNFRQAAAQVEPGRSRWRWWLRRPPPPPVEAGEALAKA